MKLRGYQDPVVDALVYHPEGVSRDLALMPTGSGKTVCFAHVIDRTVEPGDAALVLAHRRELLDQAEAHIAAVAPDIMIEREQGAVRAERGRTRSAQRRVVLASVDTLHHRRLATWQSGEFAVIVCDEAHHATAPTYRRIFNHFGCFGPRKTRLIGFTATPNRSDGTPLSEIFQRVAYEVTLPSLIAEGRLVGLRSRRVDTQTSLSQVGAVTGGDFNRKQLEAVVNVEQRNALIVQAFQEYSRNRKTVVFAAGVDHARSLAAVFSSAGIASAAVWGDMGDSARSSALARFRTGEIRVLTNYNILLEGWDEPSIETIINARPTRSLLLGTQAFGRGLRTCGDKSHLLAIDIVDAGLALPCFTSVQLGGLPADFDACGEDVFAQKRRFDSLDPYFAKKAKSSSDIDALLAGGLNLLKVVEATEEAVLSHSRYDWVAVGDEYALSIKDGPRYVISVDVLGLWNVEVRSGGRCQIISSRITEIGDAFSLADLHIANSHPRSISLLERDAPWRLQPASSDQYRLLRALGITDVSAITKGQARRLLDHAFAHRRAS